MATKAQQAREEREKAAETLREWIKPGDTVHTILRHVSSSGMTRAISLIVGLDDGPTDVSYLAARAMGEKIDQRHDGIRIGGAGMDMGFALVYNLSRTLFPDSFDCIGDGMKDCPTCGGSGKRATARSANGRELERHERSGTDCGDCYGRGRVRDPHAQPCPSNDHSNGDRDYTPHLHSDGGYALRHRWL